MSDSDGDSDRSTVDALLRPFIRVLQAITPEFIRRRYALKFGLVLLILVVVIAGIGLAATGEITAETKDNVRQEYRTSADATGNSVEQWLDRNRLSTRLISRNEELTTVVSRDVRNALLRERNNLSEDVFHLHAVSIQSEESPELVSSTNIELKSGTSLANGSRDWIAQSSSTIRDLDSGSVFVTDTYAVGNEYVIGFLSPIRDDDDRYLLTEMSVSGVADSLQGQERAEGGFTQVVDSDTNQILIGEDSERILTQYASSESALEPIRAANTLRDSSATAGVIDGIEANEVIGETYTVGYAPVEGTDWVVLTHAPQSSVFGFAQTVSNFGLYATLIAVFLVFMTGTALGHTTATAIDRLAAKTDQMKEGNLDVSFETSRTDNIGRLYDRFGLMRDALKEQLEKAERARKEAEVSQAEAMQIANYLEEQADAYSEILQQCAAGDLTQRMSKDGENEAMDTIAEEFNHMLTELEKTIGQLKSYVDEVEQAGADVEQSATTVREASEQVAESTQRIAVDAEEQKENLRELSQTMDGLTAALEDIDDEYDEVDIDAELETLQSIASEISTVADLSEEMQAETDNVSAAAQEQAAELNGVSERASALQRYARPLRGILERFDTEAEHEFVFSIDPDDDGKTPEKSED